MLKTKVIEKIRPSKKVQELFSSNQLNYISVNGYIQVIEMIQYHKSKLKNN